MKALHLALQSFWSGFAYEGKQIPAYLSGRVPARNNADNAWTDAELFPYITYEVIDGTAFSENVLTAFVWLRNSDTADKERAEILDIIREAIPYEGVRIPCADGLIELFPNEGGFMSYYDDPTDSNVLGARISYEIRFIM